MANSLDTKGIMEIIPHRHPFLLLDKVEDYVPGEYSVDKITVTWKDGSVAEFNGCICGKDAEAVREGAAEAITVVIE